MGFDPFTLMAIASTAMSAFGAIQQGNAQAATYRAQAQAQEYNATIEKNNAQMAASQANAQEEQQRRKFAMMQGEAIAGAAQSGAGLSGSNKDVIEQNALMNELDALTIRYQGQKDYQGFMAQSELDKYGAKMSRFNASTAERAGYMKAGSSILSGISSYAASNNGLLSGSKGGIGAAASSGGGIGLKAPAGALSTKWG